MTTTTEPLDHRVLDCGLELAVRPDPARRVAALEIRFMAGYAWEHPDHLGVAHVLSETITKGTARRSGRVINDAFDEIGATHSCSTGRETMGFSCLCLPEYIERAVELNAEMIREPAFPEEACAVAVDLTRQAIDALNDDPHELAEKFLLARVYGDPLGRHAYGEPSTLASITPETIREHWARHLGARRMQVAVSGAVDPDAIAGMLQRAFAGFEHRPGDANSGATDENAAAAPPRTPFRIRFNPGYAHHHKDIEQEHVALCFPGAAATDPDRPVEQVLIGILSGGMSSRLWTSVREEQGLVYWVGAWSDRPRHDGMVHLGASSTPRNVEDTCRALLHELDRLAETVTPDEVERAATGILASARTQGDLTRSRAIRLINDLFHYGRPIPVEEKLERIRAVTVDDIRRYVDTHPRDALGIVTLGPKPLSDLPPSPPASTQK